MREGWQTEKLGDICSIQLGATPARKMSRYYDSRKTTDNVWLSIADMPKTIGQEIFDSKEYLSDEGADKVKLVKKGTLLFSFKLSIGRICFAGKDLRTNEAIAALDIKDSRHIDKKYLAWFLAAQDWDLITAQDEKLLGRTLNKAKLKEINVVIPPLPEQKRIVAILDEAFAGIDQAIANTEKNLASAREIFESYLNEVFTRKGDGWEEKTVGDLSDHCLGKMLDKNKNKGTMKPYLRNLNVRWFDFNLSDLLEMRFEDTETTRYSIEKGDVVICEGGYPGRAAIWNFDKPIFFQKALHRVRFYEKLHTQWFLYFLYFSDQTNKLKNYFTGAGIQHFTGQSLNRFSIPIPPSSEIENYCRNFDFLFKETQHFAEINLQKITSLNELKQSLLQKAFSGELTSDMAANAEAAE